MAYPPAAGQREDVKDSVVPSTLAHFDMHNQNFMFGSLNPNSVEHSLVPILKLIDFDIATDQEGEGEWPDEDVLEKFDNELEFHRYNQPGGVRNHGINANVIAIGMVMSRIVHGQEPMDENTCREAMQRELPNLDNDLQLLILRCLAVDEENRPSLRELLTTAYNAVVTKDAAWYNRVGWPTSASETDEAIQRIVQKCILDANPT
ncbi:hypothetical protein F5B20DRAFT_533403 [Whalleya microplaca]|nr:hypothetical protein F5B20DRAFT_533403 [Whalleya microplaca]